MDTKGCMRAVCLKGNHAKIAQLVEHDLAKVGVAGSSPVFRSIPLFRKEDEIIVQVAELVDALL